MISLMLIDTLVIALSQLRVAIAEREPVIVVSERIFPVLECAIIFVVSCLMFRFVSPLVTRPVSLPLSWSIHIYYGDPS